MRGGCAFARGVVVGCVGRDFGKESGVVVVFQVWQRHGWLVPSYGLFGLVVQNSFLMRASGVFSKGP